MNAQDGVEAEARGEQAASVQKPSKSRDSSNTELYIPEPTAGLSDFKHQFLFGLAREDAEHSSKVSETYLATLSPEDLDAIGEWKSFCEFFKLSWSEHGDRGGRGISDQVLSCSA
ncbi:hypothetical protein [Poseidonocella sedimentorum]|uniref:hypothetical protein n=1 Tax=Poseidonocella sedimentorum TaxID=871652 RepID=UPI00116073EE|nr:hypothetical protein [Poseidonocella sedimentorum]